MKLSAAQIEVGAYIDRVLVLHSRIEELQGDLKALTDPDKMPRSVDVTMARAIYWYCPMVPSASLKAALGVKSNQQLLAILGPLEIGECACGSPITVGSRTEYESKHTRSLSECEECRQFLLREELAERLRDRRTAREKMEATRLELQTMPYSDYLQTDHWRRTRYAALKRARECCQACNSPWHLHVHHRTYKRRGCEAPADLIVLCSDCHSLFHERSALAQ